MTPADDLGGFKAAEPKHGDGCSRVDGECVNLHCPYCGEPCGLYGHPKCQERLRNPETVSDLLAAYAGQDPLDGEVGKVVREETAPAAFAAIRAVLELHSAVDFGGDYGVCCQVCKGSVRQVASWPTPYPCLTVAAISSALEA